MPAPSFSLSIPYPSHSPRLYKIRGADGRSRTGLSPKAQPPLWWHRRSPNPANPGTLAMHMSVEWSEMISSTARSNQRCPARSAEEKLAPHAPAAMRIAMRTCAGWRQQRFRCGWRTFRTYLTIPQPKGGRGGKFGAPQRPNTNSSQLLASVFGLGNRIPIAAAHRRTFGCKLQPHN